MKAFRVWLLVGFLLFSSFLTIPLSQGDVFYATKRRVVSLFEGEGIRVIFNDAELYFNASNGGEITEYYDLLVDPSRSRNLVNLGWKPYCNLLPLFASLFYRPPYTHLVFSTGGDNNAMLKLISNTSEYVILQASSRIMSRVGEVAKDARGNVVYVNSTWIIRDNGLVSVERTFFLPSYATIPLGWRWYPCYLTRRSGFTHHFTFYMFNTTYGYSYVGSTTTYKDIFDLFPVLPNDTRHVFGVAVPFSNASIGGDGAHNILIAYKYDELVDVGEWRSDNYHNNRINVTECGAVHKFSEATNVFTHTYHLIVNFTHQPIDEESVQNFASYYADDTSMALLMECSVTTNKDIYTSGEYYVFNGSGISYYNLTELTARLTVINSSNRIVYQRDYGPGNITAGQTFNLTLLEGTVQPLPDNYTLLLQIFSPFGIAIASSSKVITVTAP